jgi:hypothetical protein
MRIILGLAFILALVGAATGLVALLSEAEGPQGPQGAQGLQGEVGATGLIGPQGPAGDEACQTCHNETTLIFLNKLWWEQSGHGTGESYVRGTRSSCAGCHSSEGFIELVVAGIQPNEVEEGIAMPTPPNCRTCHWIHNDFTEDDFALTTTDPVTFFVSGDVFDGGSGTLCANCHQPRRGFPEAENGEVEVSSTHWGSHHGAQAAVLIGVGGAGEPGEPAPGHYAVEDEQVAEDTCATCHMGPNQYHDWAPDEDYCQIECHEDIEDFDFNYENVQDDVHALFDELGELLEAAHMLHDGHPVVGFYPKAQAAALWNYIIVLEDGSYGVHNSEYTKRILEEGIEAFK